MTVMRGMDMFVTCAEERAKRAGTRRRGGKREGIVVIGEERVGNEKVAGSLWANGKR